MYNFLSSYLFVSEKFFTFAPVSLRRYNDSFRKKGNYPPVCADDSAYYWK